jgi:hypothetical protein
MADNNRYWSVAGYIFLAALALVGISAATAALMGRLRTENVYGAEISLTIVLIVGVGGLLILLSSMVAIFAALNLTERTEALGLPEGTIRAVIAVSLLLIFAMQAVYLYADLSGTRLHKLEGVTQNQLENMPPETIWSSDKDQEGTYTVLVKMEKSAASVDFAKQVLTTVSTLVVAVAGFYFGSRAVKSARGAVELSRPIIRSINPTDGNRGQEISIQILGKGFQMPKTVKLVQGKAELSCDSILSSDEIITCKLKIGNADPLGKWDLIVVNQDGGEDRLTDAFEVK